MCSMCTRAFFFFLQKTISFRSAACHGRKQTKDCVSILFVKVCQELSRSISSWMESQSDTVVLATGITFSSSMKQTRMHWSAFSIPGCQNSTRRRKLKIFMCFSLWTTLLAIREYLCSKPPRLFFCFQTPHPDLTNRTNDSAVFQVAAQNKVVGTPVIQHAARPHNDSTWSLMCRWLEPSGMSWEARLWKTVSDRQASKGHSRELEIYLYL